MFTEVKNPEWPAPTCITRLYQRCLPVGMTVGLWVNELGLGGIPKDHVKGYEILQEAFNELGLGGIPQDHSRAVKSCKKHGGR